ncbi:Pyridoxal 4-dehydrogenase (fragment) [Mesorhizobium sp. STM 4661]
MNASDKKKFGRTGLEVTTMGFGTAPLGNQFRAVPEADVRDVIKGAWDSGLRYFDTAPMYGHGLSERRLAKRCVPSRAMNMFSRPRSGACSLRCRRAR